VAPELTILYRGPLASCNYACGYCPFAKRRETEAQLEADRRALERFVAWAEGDRRRPLRVFFTPWGEALVRPWYREAIVRLSSLGHVERVAAQTNLACPLDWAERCDRTRLALWCTYHPTQVGRAEFAAQCRRLDASGVRYSVGVVGLKEFFEEVEALRKEIAPEVYLWVNAYKDAPGYYAEEEVRRWEQVDPLFRISLRPHPSRGRRCRAGESVISVDGDGTIRRCHFIPEPLANLYDADFDRSLRAAPCTNDTCACHIGYVHLAELGLDEVFRGGLMERIPAKRVWGDRGKGA
jgi:MoaA/NifB/PqqE/SkfB family radical SAM enzyme